MSRNRLFGALAVYAALALLSFTTLDGVLRLAVLIFLAGLAVKTWIAYAASSSNQQ